MSRKSKKRLEMGEEKWAEYQKIRKNKKVETYRKKDPDLISEWRRRTKLALVVYKGGKCIKCGFDDLNYPSCFDFHHVDPTQKEFSIASNGSTRSIEKLKAEADKCILVCRNCHAKIHAYEQMQSRLHKFLSILSQDELFAYKSLNDEEKQKFLFLSRKDKKQFIKDITPNLFEIKRKREKKEKGTCRNCGSHSVPDRKFCAECFKIWLLNRRKAIRPSSEILEKLLWEKPTSQIAKDYGVSDNAIAKWAKAYGLEKPPRGYWGFKK